MRFFNYLPIVGFFSAFYNPFGMISYLCAVKGKGFRFSLADSLFLIFLIVVLLYHFLKADFIFTLLTFRFYFGFFIFYIFFKSGGAFPIKKVFFSLILLIPLEAVLINTVVSAVNMPNFPDADAYSHFNTGGYQRPYSFAGNSSVASSLLIAIASLLPFSLGLISILVPLIVVFASGSGFLSLLIYIGAHNIRWLFVVFLFMLPFLVGFVQYLIDYVDSLGIKLNSEYVLYLIQFKIEQITDLFDGYSFLDYALGDLNNLESGGYGGDFGWLYFILSYGFLSAFIFFVYILTKVNRTNAISIVILLLSTFHYPVIFFLPGQIILAYVMTVGKQNKI